MGKFVFMKMPFELIHIVFAFASDLLIQYYVS